MANLSTMKSRLRNGKIRGGTRICHLLLLPIELRLEIYEELLQHNGVTRKTLSPQILVTCKQIYSEASKILPANTKKMALVRIKTGRIRCDIRFDSSPAVVIPMYEERKGLCLDAALEAMLPIFDGKTYIMVYINMTSSADKTWQQVNQMLYLLVSAATLSPTVRALEVRLKSPTATTTPLDNYAMLSSTTRTLEVRLKSPTATTTPPLEYYAMLWPLTRSLGPGTDLYIQGCPDDTVLEAIKNATQPQNQVPTAALARWISLKREVDDLVKMVEEAGITGAGVRFLPRAMARMRPIAGVVQKGADEVIGGGGVMWLRRCLCWASRGGRG
ncbi:uncharacterized protein CLAFUR5_09670 [Fulvia fulva]|uniref:Uncharacterized protein n=1 Tax=Passalora fulva TaxID=5499 RepID=A0A9Q8PGP3_PASFU|nr:uncharacterized protein CLAFUR5_09670 [Fulvia fulva]UJO22082.1 hypothetical protein CLAFUR5_09670 [Fulvia fulva]